MTYPSTLVDVISEIVVGKPEAVELTVICLLAEGHLLIEDVPGTGKTTLARALAASLDARWKRIQFTPDLLPADITGTTVLDQRAQKFVFHPGPIFANVVIADEINRASPKTQSALLEVMGERTVTVDGATHPVEQPFLVIATQNPIDMEGTYALPEAQLDRFLMRISLGHLDPEDELAVIQGHSAGRTVDHLRPVMDVRGPADDRDDRSDTSHRGAGPLRCRPGRRYPQAPACPARGQYPGDAGPDPGGAGTCLPARP
jgi:MoxR-like ATPase